MSRSDFNYVKFINVLTLVLKVHLKEMFFLEKQFTTLRMLYRFAYVMKV